jgi:hypothetical protein
VQFLNCKEEATAPEEACRPFSEWGVNEDEAHIDLYNAYLLAAKDHARSKTALKESSTSQSQESLNPSEWSVGELREFLDGLMGGKE